MQQSHFYYDMFKIISLLFQQDLINKQEKDDLKFMVLESQSELMFQLQTIYRSSVKGKQLYMVHEIKKYIESHRQGSPRNSSPRSSRYLEASRMWSIYEENEEEERDNEIKLIGIRR
ncbi:unnamed protein product [Paramecium sonneborni]|uniref:Uncharacterized protein n=1 Tax=Paramecium sonneborni TaxID=65129 RepID=A0A8S1RJJ0_9CILI|nr:unnamed protein product [Paramecium sonneborni]